jgi:hypothetical protein
VKQHLIRLSNGETLCIEESDNALHIAAMHNGDVDGYICEINANGVLTYPNSGSAPEYLTRGLEKKSLDFDDTTKMAVSLDGGESYQPAPNGVRILYNDQLVPGNHKGDLHINCTNEGIIMDVWTDSTEPETGENIGTSSETVDEIILRLVEDNS